MSSEHATEQVPLAEMREGDMLQDPKAGNWIKVTQTADRTTSVTRRYSDGERTVIEQYRVYYGDGGEEIDSRFVKGLVTPGERVIASVHVTAMAPISRNSPQGLNRSERTPPRRRAQSRLRAFRAGSRSHRVPRGRRWSASTP